MKATWMFDIDDPGELAAGYVAFSDRITVTVDSGEPGGEEEGDESFGHFIQDALKEWYDGASVTEVQADEPYSKGDRMSVLVAEQELDDKK